MSYSDKTVDELADDLLEESTRIVEPKVDPEIDLNTAIYLSECAYFLDKKIRETGQLPKRWSGGEGRPIVAKETKRGKVAE